MRRAEFVDIHREAGIFANQRAGSAGMVQMDVREKDGVEIAHAEAMGLELLVKSFERGARSGVDDGAVTVRFEQGGSNGVRTPGPKIVERGDGGHSGG